jgi:hypothetical protein
MLVLRPRERFVIRAAGATSFPRGTVGSDSHDLSAEIGIKDPIGSCVVDTDFTIGDNHVFR